MKPKIICLTPIKNEAWILKLFLQCVSLWADHIIIADQGSTDGSIEIAESFEKVILVHNTSNEFNEATRQKILFNEGRKIEGPKLFIALDADEVLTSNFMDSKEWHSLLEAEPGTVVQFRLVNLKPDFKNCWIPDLYFNIGYMDDDSAHTGETIHTSRVPYNDKKVIRMNDVKLMHFQFTDWKRMQSKHRWYQCFELINSKKHPIGIYRQYHHMYAIKKREILPVEEEWYKGYEERGIHVRNIIKEGTYYWDKIVEGYFEHYGTGFFRSLVIWDQSTSAIYKDPRGPFWKMLHFYLKKTQPLSHSIFIRGIDFILKKLTKRGA